MSLWDIIHDRICACQAFNDLNDEPDTRTEQQKQQVQQ